MEQYEGIKQHTPEWYQKRSNIITATNIASILNLNPYESSKQLLKKKRSKDITSITNKAIRHGQFFESVAKDIYEQKTNHTVITPGLLIHPIYDWLGASCDGIVQDSHLVEFKCYYSKQINQSVPLIYWIQCQIQMEVLDYDKCDLVESIFKTYKNDQSYTQDTHFLKGQHQNIYWKLYDYKVTSIIRDKGWFLNNFSKINHFWKSIQKHDNNNKKRKREIDITEFYNFKQIDNYILKDPIIDYFILANFKKDNSLFNRLCKERSLIYKNQILPKYTNSNVISIDQEYINMEHHNNTITELYNKTKTIIGGVLFNFDKKIYCKYDILELGKNISVDLIQNAYYSIQIINCKVKVFKDTYDITNTIKNQTYKARAYILNELLNNFQVHKNNSDSFIVDISYLESNHYIKIKNESKINILVKEGIQKYNEIKDNLNDICIYNAAKSKVKLIPNMVNSNMVFSSYKENIVTLTKPISSIWNCNIKHQNELLDKSIYTYNQIDSDISEYLNDNKIKDTKINLINKIIQINKQSDKLISYSEFKNINNWRQSINFEFFVDFETLQQDDRTNLLYLIGLGVRVGIKWIYYYFYIDVNKPDCEKHLVLEWYNKMEKIKSLYALNSNIKTWHWSSAEKNILNAVLVKYPDIKINVDWIDLCDIFIKEEIVIKDALNYKLKSIVKTLSKHGFIKSSYDNLICDNGMDAMVDGYYSYMSAKRLNTSIKPYLVDKNIIEYNKIDCFSMYEILNYLRSL